MTRQRGAALMILLMIAGVVGAMFAIQLVGRTASERAQVAATTLALSQAREALIGFALVNGRLPCPASATSLGQESFAGGGSAANGLCSNFYDGFLPAAALGITPVDAQGYAVDAWGIVPNRIRYAVYTGTIGTPVGVLNPFTRTDGIKTAGLASFSTAQLLRVCASATGITATTCGTATVLTNTAPAVIYSVGKNAPSGGTSADEAANPNPNSANNDQVFVSHETTPVGATSGEFDDIVTWLTFDTLSTRMTQAGKFTLP